MSMNPLASFVKANLYLLDGHLRFPRNRVGQTLTMEDGCKFVIFRQAILSPRGIQLQKPGAVFRVRFHVANMSPQQNVLFSLLPVPFIVGLPGFRSKLWMLNPANGDFQGIYEWETVQDAENYAHSFAMTFMTRRSVPSLVSYQITPSETPA